jgi:hypothetical protein
MSRTGSMVMWQLSGTCHVSLVCRKERARTAARRPRSASVACSTTHTCMP